MKHLSPDEIREIEVPMLNDVQRKLRAALARLDGGRAWTKDGPDSEKGTYCTITATRNYSDIGVTSALKRALGTRYIDDVFNWNDAPERTFADVEALYHRAITLAATP